MSDINSPATPTAQDSPASARLEAGLTAPNFTLPSDNGDSITLSALRGQNIVLYFYPAAMTPGCTTEACDFRDNLARLRSRGFTVLGISKDPMDKLVRFRERDHWRQTVDFDGNYGQFCRADVETETAWFPVQTPHTANTSSEPASTICFPMHPFLGIMDDHRQ